MTSRLANDVIIITKNPLWKIVGLSSLKNF